MGYRGVRVAAGEMLAPSRLRILRTVHGLKTIQLAKLTDIHVTRLAAIEAGTLKGHPHEWTAIAQILGISLAPRC